MHVYVFECILSVLLFVCLFAEHTHTHIFLGTVAAQSSTPNPMRNEAEHLCQLHVSTLCDRLSPTVNRTKFDARSASTLYLCLAMTYNMILAILVFIFVYVIMVVCV